MKPQELKIKLLKDYQELYSSLQRLEGSIDACTQLIEAEANAEFNEQQQPTKDKD